MGTVVTEKVYVAGEDVSSEIFKETDSLINDLENKNLSWRVDGTDVFSVNKASKEATYGTPASVQVSKTTADCIRRSLKIANDSSGALDVGIGTVSHLWNFEDTPQHAVPNDADIKSALGSVDYKTVSVSDDNTVSLAKGQELDLGAVGKGLACDEVAKYLKTRNEVSGAVISVGGSILLYGQNPERDDGTFNVAIRNPFGESNDYMGIINLPGGYCVSTSGDYEKTFELDGKTYHHILDPKTGYPAESNITGVTVISKSGIDTDALSTAAFIMGYGDKTLELLKKYDAEAIFITHDKKVYITSGLQNKFSLYGEKSDFTLEN